MRIRIFALAALVVAGCHWNLNDKGTDPATGQLYFPSGIAMDPGGRFVYVSNGNADLRFGGGTVMMVDMLAFECTVAAVRARAALATTPIPGGACDGVDWLKLADTVIDNKNGQTICTRDPLDPSIVDCDETAFILQNSTVKIGNFAGTIRVVPDNDVHRTLFVAVRGDPSITKIDVKLPGFPGGVAQNIGDPGLLDCFSPAVYQSLKQRPQYSPPMGARTWGLTTAPPSCDAGKLIQDYLCQAQPTCLQGNDQFNKTQLPTEPFSMQVDNSTMPPRLLVSHLATGQVSVINTKDDPSIALKSESSAFFPPDGTGRHGAFGLAQQNKNDPHSTWYLTSTVNPQIATFRVGDSEIVIPQSTFGINASFAQGGDVRDIVFDNGGNRALITENNPPSVIVMDTRPVTDGGSGNLNLVTDIIDICQTPSHMGVRRLTTAGADGTTPIIKTKLVVVCFLSSQVMIVDPDRPGVDDTIFNGFAGPNDVAFNFANDDDPTSVTSLLPRHAYVTNYSDSTIGVIDLEPHSTTENRVIARLGYPLGSDGFNP
jgi:hypothetical protein